MKKIEKLIQWCNENNERKEYVLIKSKLKMIETLSEELPSLEDNRFLEEIIDAFSEILYIQQEIIDDMKLEYSYFNVPKLETQKESFKENLGNPYLPPDGVFLSDKQLSNSFSNYLQFHSVKRLSKLTAYDYSSRVKNLWSQFVEDFKKGELNEVVHFSKEKEVIGSPLISIYNNIEVLLIYVDYKSEMFDKGTTNYKNWLNASAALNKFSEFKSAVEINIKKKF